MKQDKSTLVGLLLMGVILIVFNTFFFPKSNSKQDQQKNLKDTILPIANNTKNAKISENKIADAITDSILQQHLESQFGVFVGSLHGKESVSVLENEKIKVSISNKGGRITSVILKEFQSYDKKPLDIMDKDSSQFNLQFTIGQSINTSDLFFVPKANDSVVSMKLLVDSVHFVEYVYTLRKDYMVDFDMHLVGMEQLIPPSVNYLNLQWDMKTPQTEKNRENQQMYTGIYYQIQTDKEVEDLGLSSSDEEKVNAKLSWVAFKQQFFSTIFIAKEGFEKPTHLQVTKHENSKYVKDLSAQFEMPYMHTNKEEKHFQFYFGPNDFKALKSYESGFENLIPLGWGIFGWINQYVIINLFDFLNGFISNYGIIILLLTIIIKLALSPFTFKAYLSQAKMKVLKPEIDKISEKYKGNDPLKMQQETMNIYRKSGVSPFGGCLPMLFQIPILFAMFRFFPASIELRQKSFLWADDLSAYDSIFDLGFDIPFYGDHISLFTLLMTISTIMYTRMNASSATGQMAQMKWIMYLMPIMFLGFFNNYAAALSYYYFLANILTFGQQLIMKRWVDENALLAQIEANKQKPAKPKSKFQKKLEELQKKQEQQLKNRKK